METPACEEIANAFLEVFTEIPNAVRRTAARNRGIDLCSGVWSLGRHSAALRTRCQFCAGSQGTATFR